MNKAERLAGIQGQVAAAAKQAGRAPGDVRLMAVSKTKPWEDVRDFIDLGVRDFGENYVQDALPKIEASRALGLADLRWHFIGSLQSNKAKLVAGSFSLFHALDSLSLAKKLGAAASAKGLVQDCLVEVNVDDEASKAGLAPAALPAFLGELAAVEGVRVTGLMCIPAPPLPGRSAREPFARLRELRDSVNAAGVYPSALNELSMGMSADFAEAILEGATYVRVGTSLFGAREPRA
ncbi:MAG: YggS family pyridoxal phosphate-dependent enzyme [Proteobacteria bacterium]|nr:MAG: YggS family pyridoxal phosphate-dependent enzyme [Pseudomonadota bacterium]